MDDLGSSRAKPPTTVIQGWNLGPKKWGGGGGGRGFSLWEAFLSFFCCITEVGSIFHSAGRKGCETTVKSTKTFQCFGS